LEHGISVKYAKVSGDLPGEKASEVIGVMKKNCYDSTFTYPLVIASGSGCVLKDIDGNSFLDFTSNIGACPLGYSHPEITEVLSNMSRNGVHKMAGQDFYCREHAELAEEFISIVPSGFKAFFVNSGAEAVENALKVAYRKKFSEGRPILPGVSCNGAFHGRTLGALTFTFSKPVQKEGFPELPVVRIPFCTTDDDSQIDMIENVLAQTRVAFVLTEVIQGEGGYNIASLRFIQNLRKSTEKYGVPLIIDEVQSGLGRTGKWWAFEHYGISPDILSAAKALQVGATAYRADYDPSRQGVLSSTWGGGSRIDLAVGATVIQIIKRDNLLSNALAMGERLKKGLTELAGKRKNGISDVRGLGLMIGIDFDSKERRDSALQQAFRHGLLLLPAGHKTVRVIPPLIITEEEVDEGIEIISGL
jgi:4-aminobutyrate aminotransferase